MMGTRCVLCGALYVCLVAAYQGEGERHTHTGACPRCVLRAGVTPVEMRRLARRVEARTREIDLAQLGFET